MRDQQTESTDPAVVLRAAAELLREGWTQSGLLAIDLRGVVAAPRSPNACRFCVLGAIERVSPKQMGTWDGYPAAVVLTQHLRPDLKRAEITDGLIAEVIGRFNDSPKTDIEIATETMLRAGQEWQT